MAVWYIVLLSTIIGVVANEHDPVNPPYLLEEVKATAESRVLERVEHLLQSLSAKIKVLDDGIDGMKRDISSLFLAQNQTHEMIQTTSKSLENVSAELQSFSLSTTQRMTNLDHNLEQIPVNTFTERVIEMKRDISSLLVVQKQSSEIIKTTSKSLGNVWAELQRFSISTTQRIINLDHKLERYSVYTLTDRVNEMKRDISSLVVSLKESSEMFKTTNKSLGKVSEQLDNFSTSTTQRIASLGHKFGRFPENTGVYFMQPDPSKNITFAVSRDWTNNHGFGGDWIVFQRRINGSVDFYRNWTEYKDGFGDVRGEHWLGLDKLQAIVETRQHELLIVLEDFDGVIAYAHYDDFKIGRESEKYIIKSVGSYIGTAGDSLSYHKGCLFSTYDQDNDKDDGNCAEFFKGAWWFHNCYTSHLNGKYLKGKLDYDGGIAWNEWRGNEYSLKSSQMMVRPVT